MEKIKEDILTPSQIAKMLNLQEQNIRKRYKNIPKKQTFYTVMKIGCYAVEKGLTEHEAAKALSDMASTKEVLDGR